jgi:hypothetical protein
MTNYLGEQILTGNFSDLLRLHGGGRCFYCETTISKA